MTAANKFVVQNLSKNYLKIFQNKSVEHFFTKKNSEQISLWGEIGVLGVSPNQNTFDEKIYFSVKSVIGLSNTFSRQKNYAPKIGREICFFRDLPF